MSRLEKARAWARFAAAALAGQNAWPDRSRVRREQPEQSDDQAVERSSVQADMMLEAYEVRFGGKS